MNLGKLAISLPIPPDVSTCLDWARRSEDLGYESIWIAETGGPDPFILAATAAQVTKRARIGIAVSPAYIRTPATIAAAAGTVSQLAPGRFVLGLGSSSHAMVENWHGTPFRRPLGRVRETVTAVRGMLAGQKVVLEGKTLRTRGFRLLVPPATEVPIYIGALRPAMLELAGEIGDGLAVNLFPADALPRMLEHVAEGARKAGKDPDGLEVVCRHQVVVTDDKAAAREMFRAGLAGYFATPVYNKFAAWYGFDEEAEYDLALIHCATPPPGCFEFARESALVQGLQGGQRPVRRTHEDHPQGAIVKRSSRQGWHPASSSCADRVCASGH